MTDTLDPALKHQCLSLSAVARELGVAPRTIRHWIDLGHLPALRLPGAKTRVVRADLERFLAQAAAGRHDRD